jgi:hypothetical protein
VGLARCAGDPQCGDLVALGVTPDMARPSKFGRS